VVNRGNEVQKGLKVSQHPLSIEKMEPSRRGRRGLREGTKPEASCEVNPNRSVLKKAGSILKRRSVEKRPCDDVNNQFGVVPESKLIDTGKMPEKTLS